MARSRWAEASAGRQHAPHPSLWHGPRQNRFAAFSRLSMTSLEIDIGGRGSRWRVARMCFICRRRINQCRTRLAFVCWASPTALSPSAAGMSSSPADGAGGISPSASVPSASRPVAAMSAAAASALCHHQPPARQMMRPGQPQLPR